VLVFIVGLTPSAVFWVTSRGHHTRVAIVKLTVKTQTGLTIVSQPENAPDEFEKQHLSGLGINGQADVTNVFDLGPGSDAPSHTIIVLSEPLKQEVSLKEGRSNLMYLQHGETWLTSPTNGATTWRTIQMYPREGGCSVVAVLIRPDQRVGTQGPCWPPR
jgi:hypothetical protein